MDSHMVHEQDISAHALAVFVLRTGSNRLSDTEPLMPSFLEAASKGAKGTLTFIQ